MAEKSYVVLSGVVSVPDGDSVYKGAVVKESAFGEQLQRHLDSGAIRQATTYEAKVGISNPPGEPSLEDEIEEAKAQIEAQEGRIETLKARIVERDDRLAHAAKKKEGMVDSGGAMTNPPEKKTGADKKDGK